MIRRRAVCTVLLASCVLLAGWNGAAEQGVDTLFRLGVSGRSLGLGGVSAALDDGAAAATLNPALLGRVDGMGVASLYAQLFGGASYGALSFAAPCVGLAAAFVDSGWIASGDAGLRFTSQGLVAAAAIPVGPVSGGARWRLLRAGSPFSGHGWAVDLGLLLDLDVVRIGGVWDAALSSPMTYGASREAWEPDLRLGAAVTLSPFENVTWTATVDVSGILEAPLRIMGGAEAWVGVLAARLGWDGEGPTLGLSVRISGAELDWSYAVRSDLGTSHRVSLEILF